MPKNKNKIKKNQQKESKVDKPIILDNSGSESGSDSDVPDVNLGKGNAFGGFLMDSDSDSDSDSNSDSESENKNESKSDIKEEKVVNDEIKEVREEIKKIDNNIKIKANTKNKISIEKSKVDGESSNKMNKQLSKSLKKQNKKEKNNGKMKNKNDIDDGKSNLFVEDIELIVDGKVLINESRVVINTNTLYVCAGANGVGKSSLLKYIYKKIKTTTDIDVLMIDQHVEIEENEKIYDFVLKANKEMYEKNKEFVKLEEKEELTDEEMNLYQELSEYLDKYRKVNNRMPSKEEIADFKKRYKNLYLKEYYHKNKYKKRILKLTFTKEEYKILEKFCEQYKKKQTPLAREIILKTIKEQKILSKDTEDKLQEIMIQIRKIGNNINQQTKLAHQVGAVAYENTFTQTLKYLEELEDKILKNLVEI